MSALDVERALDHLREVTYWRYTRPVDRALWWLAGQLPHRIVTRVLSLAAAATTRPDEHPGGNHSPRRAPRRGHRRRRARAVDRARRAARTYRQASPAVDEVTGTASHLAALREVLGDDVVERMNDHVDRMLVEQHAEWQNEREADRLRRLFATTPPPGEPGEVETLRAQLDEHRARRTRGGPPPACTPDWAGLVTTPPPATASDDRLAVPARYIR